MYYIPFSLRPRRTSVRDGSIGIGKFSLAFENDFIEASNGASTVANAAVACDDERKNKVSNDRPIKRVFKFETGFNDGKRCDDADADADIEFERLFCGGFRGREFILEQP